MAVTADVPDDAPRVTDIGVNEVEAIFPLRNVKLVAGLRRNGVPREIFAQLARTSVPIHLPPGKYLLLAFPYPDARRWIILRGAPGIFHIVDGSSAQEQCMLHGIGMDATQDEVIDAAREARGPVEPLAAVIATLQKLMGCTRPTFAEQVDVLGSAGSFPCPQPS